MSLESSFLLRREHFIREILHEAPKNFLCVRICPGNGCRCQKDSE